MLMQYKLIAVLGRLLKSFQARTKTISAADTNVLVT